VKQSLKQQFLHLYLRDLHPEMSALKAARQSQKAEVAQWNDLSQQSMQNQLNALTSFLRKDMETRAQQHADQIYKNEEPPIFVRVNGTSYPVPLNVTMSVQSVLDYMNEHYYISLFVPNCSVMKLIKSGKRMDPALTLEEYNVLNEDTLHAMCVMPVHYQNGGQYGVKNGVKRTAKRTKRQSRQH
jgi:hypothetical protein